MDCLTAQSLISEAMDHRPLDAALLAEAKQHCRTCADCARFVRGQLVAKQAPLPQPPADLADRAIAAVRAEARLAAEQAASEAAAAQAAAGSAERPGDDAEAATSRPVTPEPIATLVAPAQRTRRMLPRPFVVGGLAAAVLLALLGSGSVVIFGMRQLNPQREATSSTYLVNPQAGSAAGTAQDSGTGKAAEQAAPSAGVPQSRNGAATAVGPRDITVNGVVYALTGSASTDLTGKTGIGQTTSSLGSTTTPTSRTVFAGPTADTVYVADEKGQAIGFARVTRTYLGQSYVLTAAELTGFGQWPGLPSQVPTPASTDGQPTFLFDGTDGNGVRIYRLSTSPATAGIALAPNSDTGGPVAGDPNWTWWTPLR